MATEAKLTRYTFPLESGDDAVMFLPRDLTPSEALRVAGFIRSLVLAPTEEAPTDGP